MALWGNLDQANNAPKYKGVEAAPIYAVKYNHVGPASKIVFPSGASYNNTDILVVNAGTSATYSNATFALFTNTSGFIQAVSKITPGSFSSNTVAGVLGFAITNTSYGSATGNTTVTGFTATVDQRLSGIEMYGNTTVSAFVNNEAVGVFGVDHTETSVTSRGYHQGWVKRTVGEGPVTAVSDGGGSNIANGETITLSNGSSLGLLTITSNATGNISSVAITKGGIFDVNTNVVVAFNREKHVANSGVAINYTGTATGYNNTDVVTVANGITNATASVSTNATGGSLTFTITNVGLFSNTAANNSVAITIANSTGGASLGTGATFTTANLVSSTGGSVTVNTLGGRAGRINYETLVCVHMASENSADNTQFPNS